MLFRSQAEPRLECPTRKIPKCTTGCIFFALSDNQPTKKCKAPGVVSFGQKWTGRERKEYIVEGNAHFGLSCVKSEERKGGRVQLSDGTGRSNLDTMD